jgi:hypothetical protein
MMMMQLLVPWSIVSIVCESKKGASMEVSFAGIGRSSIVRSRFLLRRRKRASRFTIAVSCFVLAHCQADLTLARVSSVRV